MIDLTITSPPYDALRTYNGFDFEPKAIIEGLHRTTKKGGVVVWIVNDGVEKGSETGSSFRQALMFLDAGFTLHDTMIWQKVGVGHPDPTRYHQCFEYMFVFSKGRPKTVNLIADRPNKHAGEKQGGTQREADGSIGKRWGAEKGKKTKAVGIRYNVWQVNQSKVADDELWKKHPATFPLSLIKDHVLTWSNTGDVVCDPMSGSGQTALAALSSGRWFTGCDISKEYAALANKRISSFLDNRP
jgi:site-specific DNA-methyltransferase (adenine-specific)